MMEVVRSFFCVFMPVEVRACAMITCMSVNALAMEGLLGMLFFFVN